MPNPVVDFLKVSYHSGTNICNQILILDSNNKIVMAQELASGEGEAIISSSSLPNGVYFIKLMSRSKMESISRFVVIK